MIRNITLSELIEKLKEKDVYKDMLIEDMLFQDNKLYIQLKGRMTKNEKTVVIECIKMFQTHLKLLRV